MGLQTFNVLTPIPGELRMAPQNRYFSEGSDPLLKLAVDEIEVGTNQLALFVGN